jgi:hypothetical protein
MASLAQHRVKCDVVVSEGGGVSHGGVEGASCTFPLSGLTGLTGTGDGQVPQAVDGVTLLNKACLSS